MALRIKAKPVKNEFHEWLEYSFSDTDVQPAGKINSANINLMWDRLKVSFKIEVKT